MDYDMNTKLDLSLMKNMEKISDNEYLNSINRYIACTYSENIILQKLYTETLAANDYRIISIYSVQNNFITEDALSLEEMSSRIYDIIKEHALKVLLKTYPETVDSFVNEDGTISYTLSEEGKKFCKKVLNNTDNI